MIGGLSLVELMVVVGIVSILTVVGTSQIQKYRDRAIDAAMSVKASSLLKEAIGAFADANGPGHESFGAWAAFPQMYGCTYAEIMAATTSNCLANPKPAFAVDMNLSLTETESRSYSIFFSGYSIYYQIAVLSHARLRKRPPAAFPNLDVYWASYAADPKYCDSRTTIGWAVVYVATQPPAIPSAILPRGEWRGPFAYCP